MTRPSDADPGRDADRPPRLLVCNDVETAYDDPDRIARLAGAIRERRDDRTLVLDAGDSTALGALAFSTDRGRAHALPFHEAVEPDAHVPGNHDFDEGFEAFAAFADAASGAWLAANVDGGDGLDPLGGTATVERAGAAVAVVGVIHPDTPEICGAVADLSVEDPVATARREVDRVRDAGADHVVVVSHCGALDADLARETDADVVVGGHDHRRVVETVDGTLVARTAGKGRELLAVELGGTPHATIHDTAGEPADPDVAAEYRERNAAAGLDQRVATLDGALDRRETAAVVAAAYREGADADAGVIVEASVREPLSGTVTTGDLVGTVPFGSDLVAVELPGEDLRRLLDASGEPIDDTHGRAVWAGADPEAGTVGGATPTDRTYRVAMMSNLPHTAVLPGVRGDRIVAEHGPQHEHVLDYVRREGM